ncbi:MAG: ABC transporter permease [Promethearchaeota archaeon]
MDLSALITKEFERIKADKRTLVLLFLIPAIVLVIFGLSSGGGPITLFKATIVTRDGETGAMSSSPYDSSLITSFQSSTVFNLRGISNATNETVYQSILDRDIGRMRDDTIDAIIVIPANFSENVAAGANVTLIVYVDGSDEQVSGAIHVALQEPIATFRVSEGLVQNLTIMVPYLEFDVPFWENQVLNYAFPIIISMILMGTCMNLTSLSIVSEKPLSRMLLTPTGKTNILFSKFIANNSIMVIQVSEIFTIAALFGLFSRGEIFFVYVSLIIIGFVGVCTGLFISAMSKTEPVANQMFMMFFIAFTMFCQNFLPMDNIPNFMRGLTSIFPLTHAIPLLGDIMLKGMGMSLIHTFFLLGIGFFFYIGALIAYSLKKVEV